MRATRVAVLVAIAFVTWLALDLILLLVAGILLAILLRSAGNLLAERTGLKPSRAVGIVLLVILGVIGAVGWFAADRLAQQTDQLAEAIPAAVTDVTSWLRQYGWGRWILDQAETLADGADNGMLERATSVFGRVTNAVVAIIVVLFTGLYLAFEPEPYIRGILRLVPLEHRQRAAEVLFAAGGVLRWWLFGQLISMLLVGLTMGIGLGLIGVPLAFVLGVLAGLFEFIPLLGPLLGLGPALLLAVSASTEQAAYVLMLYAAVQTFEGYVLTPLVQRRAVELPPVVTITAQVALSWAAGPIGLLVAVPTVAVLMVGTQMLYVRDALQDEMEPEWQREARASVKRERTRTLRGLLPQDQGGGNRQSSSGD